MELKVKKTPNNKIEICIEKPIVTRRMKMHAANFSSTRQNIQMLFLLATEKE